MAGTQHSNDDDASGTDYTAIAERYHQAAVHRYRLGQYEEAQRLAGIALRNRAKAHARFLKESQTEGLAADADQITAASR